MKEQQGKEIVDWRRRKEGNVGGFSDKWAAAKA
jgi:hypothetical protein